VAAKQATKVYLLRIRDDIILHYVKQCNWIKVKMNIALRYSIGQVLKILE
jgi:hypothetical protein